MLAIWERSYGRVCTADEKWGRRCPSRSDAIVWGLLSSNRFSVTERSVRGRRGRSGHVCDSL